MKTKLTLNVGAMQEEFFEDAAFIGLSSALHAYRLCWLINRHFDFNFCREPELDIKLKNKKGEFYFPVYEYLLPLNGARYLIYKINQDKVLLVPELKNLNYLWLIKSCDAEQLCYNIINHLKQIPEIELALSIAHYQLKNGSNLLV